ncbi:hypothetical protein [uncultured Robinsoniella sp.]
MQMAGMNFKTRSMHRCLFEKCLY